MSPARSHPAFWQALVMAFEGVPGGGFRQSHAAHSAQGRNTVCPCAHLLHGAFVCGLGSARREVPPKMCARVSPAGTSSQGGVGGVLAGIDNGCPRSYTTGHARATSGGRRHLPQQPLAPRCPAFHAGVPSDDSARSSQKGAVLPWCCQSSPCGSPTVTAAAPRSSRFIREAPAAFRLQVSFLSAISSCYAELVAARILFYAPIQG